MNNYSQYIILGAVLLLCNGLSAVDCPNLAKNLAKDNFIDALEGATLDETDPQNRRYKFTIKIKTPRTWYIREEVRANLLERVGAIKEENGEFSFNFKESEDLEDEKTVRTRCYYVLNIGKWVPYTVETDPIEFYISNVLMKRIEQ